MWPNPDPIPSTYVGEISTLKTWIANRLLWIDGHIDKVGKCVVATLPANAGFEINAWPNPILNPLNLNIISDKDQSLQIIVANIYGQRILQSSISIVRGSNIMKINTGSWAKGVYIIKALSKDGTKKIISIEK